MYTDKDFKTKKELKEAVAAGKQITVYQPGPFGGNEPRDGTVTLEGPHYPKPHTWYLERRRGSQGKVAVQIRGCQPLSNGYNN
jgi:hypothetical protein